MPARAKVRTYMGRYHFHISDEDVHLDLHTAELTGDIEILERAERLATALLREPASPYAADPDEWEIRVTDDRGVEVLTLPLSEIAGRGTH